MEDRVRLGDCAALTTLNLFMCFGLTALPERLGDCTALATLNLVGCVLLPSHLDVVDKLKARGCKVDSLERLVKYIFLRPCVRASVPDFAIAHYDPPPLNCYFVDFLGTRKFVY